MAVKQELQNVECICKDNIPCCSGYIVGVGTRIFRPSEFEKIKLEYNITSYSADHIAFWKNNSSSAVLKTVAQTVVNSQTTLPTVSTTPIIPKPIIQTVPTTPIRPTIDMSIFQSIQPINPGPIANSKLVAPAPKPKDNFFVAFWRRLFG